MPDLAHLAGSVLCAGFPGSDPEDSVLAQIEELGLGALVLFTRNVSDVPRTRALVAAVRTAAGGDVPALVCVDQEGGRVARLRFGGELPAMLALGATNDAKLAERAGARIAGELRAVGADVAFAPVLDLALEPAGTVIGTRSLGDDPNRVARLGAALVRGLQAGGVAATVKHFPGHGATAADSHVALASIGPAVATLHARELVPFRAAFAAGARAVMTAHVVVSALDAERPATLSTAVLTTLLREELGFTGVCFTDCLQMAGLASDPAHGAALALVAGADCVVVSNDLALARAARDGIVEAVESGALSIARLEEAAGRVRALRRELAANAPSATPPPYPADDGLAREIAAAAIAVLRGPATLAPERPVTVVSFESDGSDGVAAATGDRPSLSLALRRRRLRSELLRVAGSPDSAMREMLVEVLRTQGERNVVVVTRRAHLSNEQRRAVDALLTAAPEAVVVSALEPFDAVCFPQARTLLCSFGDDEVNVEAVADVLTGRSVARGSLPVALAKPAPA